MAPFRPANLNKRAYPGNAGIIGPTCTATVGITTTTCCSSTNVFGACTNVTLNLGCRYGGGCACPCCCVCCSCSCTVCIRTVPSGRWKASEQYEAATRCAWGANTCSADNCICLCCINVGYACSGSGFVDYKGFFICCGGATKWIVAPKSAEPQGNIGFNQRNSAVTCANSVLGCCSWFVPSCDQLLNPGYSCRTYWDYENTEYWSDTAASGFAGWKVNFVNGATRFAQHNHFGPVRAFRCA